MDEVDWRGLSDSTIDVIDGDDSVSSLLGMATKPIRFKVKLHFFFIKHINFDLGSGYYFFPIIFFVSFSSRGSWKKIRLKRGKLRETKFGHVEAKASSAVPTCGVYLATWPVKRVRIFAKSGLDNC